MHAKAFEVVDRADKVAILAVAKTNGIAVDSVVDAIMNRAAPEGEAAARLRALTSLGSTTIVRIRSVIASGGGWPYDCGQCGRENAAALAKCVICDRMGCPRCVRGNGCPGCDGDRAVAKAAAVADAASAAASLESEQRATERAAAEAASAAVLSDAASPKTGKAGDA